MTARGVAVSRLPSSIVTHPAAGTHAATLLGG
jgi:hypothetical protein